MKASPSWHHSFLLFAFLIHVTPRNLRISSSHLTAGLPCFLFPCSGIHSVTILVQRWSVVLAMCPTHCHFSFFILHTMSGTPVCCLSHILLFLSLLVVPTILLWVILSLSCILLVMAHF